jgi:ACS family D-galactonate transporter-like MFS transporter
MADIKALLREEEEVQSQQRRAAPRFAVRWQIVGLLTLGITIAYIDRINLSSALPEVRKTIPLSPSAAGLLLSAFFWSYSLLHIPAGWVVDRFGIKWPLAIAFFLWSCACAGTAMVGTLTGLVLMRLLLGVGESIVVPASMRYMRAVFSEKERGLAVGIYFAGTKFGPAIGAPLAVYLVASHGWQRMFELVGLVSFAWLVPWLILMKRDSSRSTTREASSPESRTYYTWASILSSPAIWGTVLGTFCYNYFVYFCMTWMPTYFKERHGLSLTDSGWFMFMSFGGMAAIAIFGGWAADRLIANGHNPVNVRKGFTMVGFVLALSQVGGAFTHSASLSLFLSVFSLVGLGLATANYWALTQTLVTGSASGRVTGIQNAAASSAGIAAPWITGSLMEKTGSFEAPILAIGFWMSIGLGSYFFLVRAKFAPRQTLETL